MNASEKTPKPADRSTTRRHITAKEVPQFQWRLIGHVDGLTVTLLKAVERTELEPQCERLKGDGYYRGVAIYPIDAKVPPDPLAAKFAREKKAAQAKPAAKKTRKKAKKKAKAVRAKAKVKKKPAKRPARTTTGKKTTAKKTSGKKTTAKKKPTKMSKSARKPKTSSKRSAKGKK